MQDNNLWAEQAKRWKYVKQPLRPSREDIAHVENCYWEMLRYNFVEKPKGILLGVTPELADAHLNADIIAVDSEQAMIDLVWPGNSDKRKAIVGDWFALSEYTTKVDWVMGDGCLNALEYSSYRKLFHSVSNVLKAGGECSLRFFQRPATQDSLFNVLSSPENYGNFHIFKWHIVMAMQPKLNVGVKLDDVWRLFDQTYPDQNILSAMTGWDTNEINTINNYKGVQSKYSFPRVMEVVEVAKEFNLVLLRTTYQKYELGERCPHLLFIKQ